MQLTSDREPRKSRIGGIILLVGWIVAGAAPLGADQILLQNGHRLEGRVEPAGEGKIRILVDEGQSVVVELAQVRERIPGEAPIDAFERRLGEIDPGDRDRFIDLAGWAEERGLRRTARRAWREVMRLDPHHRGARNRLGYALHRNRWVRREVLEDRGLKLFRGAFMTDEEIAELKAAEGMAQLDALLADAGHDNRFVRENAMLKVLQISDPALLPALLRRLSDRDPLRRMLVGRALGNYPFEDSGEAIYRAFLGEARHEVRSAWAAVLRATGRREIGSWLARDLAAPGEDPVRRRALLVLMESCPTRTALPFLIDWVDDPGWGAPANRLLAALSGVPERDAAAWLEWWAGPGASLPEDLGRDWLGAD